jgi:biopolymer transport protein ExbD
MNLVPEEELYGRNNLNLAPMVDFLFLIVAVFATLAVTRATLFDSDINLVKVTSLESPSDTLANDDLSIINLAVTSTGQYKWVTEFNEYLMENISSIEQELTKQQKLGLLPSEHEKTKILLHVDKKAEWEPVVQLIFALKKSGFQISPVYESDEAV